METRIMDGKALAFEYQEKIKAQIAKMERTPTLAVILVGNDPASEIYVRHKRQVAERVGMVFELFQLSPVMTEEALIAFIQELNTNDKVDGILVQLPLPNGISEENILKLIPAEKDVDGFLAENLGNLAMGKPSTVACTPFGVIKMLKRENIELSGKNAVVIGRSNIVGKPMAMLLLNENCTVTICHSKTKNLKEICSQADILVAAIGKPEFVKQDMVKEGAVVIDVGINRLEKGLVGDVDFNEVSKKASFITPVPGGVGPMTIAMLMENTYNCALRRENDL